MKSNSKDFSYIFHIDFDSYFVSAIRSIRPELIDKPVVVARNTVHAIAISVSYEIKELGHSAGDKVYEIKKTEPRTVVVESRHDLYSTISSEIFKYLKSRFSKKIEISSIDECFLFFDNNEIHNDEEALMTAFKLQKEVMDKFRIPLTVGISKNKFYAKMTTNISKPFGVGLTNRENYKERFFNLDIEKFHGIGSKLANKMKENGIFKIGDLLKHDLSSKTLRDIFGTTAYKYINALDINLQDDYNYEEDIKGIGNEVSFKSSTKDEVLIDEALNEMIHKVSSRLKLYEKMGNIVTLVVRTPSKKWISKQTILDRNVQSYEDISRIIFKKFEQHFLDKEILGVGVRITGLIDSYNNFEKVSLLSENKKNISLIDNIISEVKSRSRSKNIYTLSDLQKKQDRENRYGKGIITTGLFKK
ncbi:Y-family DNA polymerase [Mycoplasmopsis canis]|uniref:Y-family DNA polymerase n=1 Tax=Mycoplasmopsis canis TaxID=29555 RepID=UPI00025B0361|nr:DNA polymerase IV [Mycoplasmopsis canis]EIE39355.1 damage-repair DNA polymerase IV [Mycoplasmopsis canis UF33]